MYIPQGYSFGSLFFVTELTIASLLTVDIKELQHFRQQPFSSMQPLNFDI